MNDRTRQPAVRRIAVASAALLLACATTATAAEPGAAEPETLVEVEDAQAVEMGVSDEPERMQISLTEAIQLGLENNLDIEIERHGPLIADEDQKISWGAYDPIVSGEVGYFDSSQPTANPLAGRRATREVTDGTIGISGLIPYVGASLALDLEGSETVANLSVVNTLQPQYDAGVSLTATVPLLKGLIWNEPWTRVKTSALLRTSADQGFRASLMDAVTTIEAAYWNLVASHEQRRVAKKSLETTQALLAQVETQYEVGVVSRVDVTEAEAGVAEREVSMIRAENTYRTAQDTLVDLVFGPRLTATSALELQATDAPDDYVFYEVDTELALAKALAQRPELAIAQSALEQSELNLKFARNQRLPQVDLVARYAGAGLTGDRDANSVPDFTSNADPQPFLPPSNGSLGDSFDAISGSNGGDDYSIRAIVSVPLGSYATRHSVSKARLEQSRAKHRLARLRQSIVFEIRDRARSLESAQRGIEAAERRRIAAEEQLRAERIRLEHGESTPFDVLQRERDLVDAESQKIASLQIYRTSAADLHRVQGTTLQSRNILIDDVKSLR